MMFLFMLNLLFILLIRNSFFSPPFLPLFSLSPSPLLYSSPCSSPSPPASLPSSSPSPYKVSRSTFPLPFLPPPFSLPSFMNNICIFVLSHAHSHLLFFLGNIPSHPIPSLLPPKKQAKVLPGDRQ